MTKKVVGLTLWLAEWKILYTIYTNTEVPW
jgi:hypothetical protein